MKRFTFACALAAALWLGVADAKPPGGGDGGGTPSGSIYFKQGYILDAEAVAYQRMNADGSGKVLLATGVWGEASRQLHADGSGGQHRWFLKVIAPLLENNSYSNEGHLFAVREDGAIQVQLTSTPLRHPLPQDYFTEWARGEPPNFQLRWAFDDSFVSVAAADDTGEGIFKSPIVFDAAGIPSLAGPFTAVLRDVYIRGFDWSPTGDRVVHWRGAPPDRYTYPGG
jgi:hypothetical protein